MDEQKGIDLVEVRISIAARPETVFRFLSDPESFEMWMGAGSSIGQHAGADFRVVYPNGQVAAGVVDEIVVNRRVVMSWGYEHGVNGVPVGATRVEISLTPESGGTLVTLRHSGLRDAEQRRNHRTGWRYYLATLSQLATAVFDTTILSLVETYVKAWAEHDPTHRLELLKRCWAEDGVFCDAMGYAAGIDDLNDHIGMAQRFARGISMELVGAPSRSHGFVSHRWRMVAPDGTPLLSGSNTIELDVQGFIVSLVGFVDR